MRKIRYEFLLIAALILTIGTGSAFADRKKDDPTRVPKGKAQITVTTSEVSYPVKIDGEYAGMSGVSEPARFNVDPDVAHTVVVEGPDGTEPFSKTVTLIKGERECICLKTVVTTTRKNCPYDIRLEGPASIKEGELFNIVARNVSTENPVPLRYKWSVSGGRITSGLETSSITIDSTGMGSRTITAELDVNDDVYSAQCRQLIPIPTDVVPYDIPPPPIVKCDEVVYKSHDDDKARLDNCVIAVQNSPDSQLYLIIYQGTAKGSPSYDSLANRARQYLVNVRGLDPSRIQLVRGPDKPRTTYEMYIVPPGAQPPVPR